MRTRYKVYLLYAVIVAAGGTLIYTQVNKSKGTRATVANQADAPKVESRPVPLVDIGEPYTENIREIVELLPKGNVVMTPQNSNKYFKLADKDKAQLKKLATLWPDDRINEKQMLFTLYARNIHTVSDAKFFTDYIKGLKAGSQPALGVHVVRTAQVMFFIAKPSAEVKAELLSILKTASKSPVDEVAKLAAPLAAAAAKVTK
jgi:hypothetical protein